MAYSCKKKVYKTMCESPTGERRGRTKKVRYSSTPKRKYTKGGKKR